MLTTFFFAKLWRRAGVLTEIELIELRYGGRPAAILRGFKAVYLGLFMNVLIIGWVNFAMITIIQQFFGLELFSVYVILFFTMLLAATYSSISGIWGVAVTDVVQFVIAIAGTIILAVIVVNQPEVGGLSGLKAKLPDSTFNFFPVLDSGAIDGQVLTISFGAFFAYLGIQWYSSWYPGQEPGGGGYIAQRMMSTKTEKGSVYATLLFQVSHYCLRPWPWIIVALSCLLLYPELSPIENPESSSGEFGKAYVRSMRDYLPIGLKGLLLASFLGAYLSTISTQLNWGAGYLVNDFYKRFIAPDKSDKLYVKSSRIVTLFLMLAGLFITLLMNSVWIVVMYLTKPETQKTLFRFYEQVKPDGNWSGIPKEKRKEKNNLAPLFVSWIASVAMAYSVLFTIGKFLFSEWRDGFIYLSVSLVSLAVLIATLKRTSIWK
ncbi:MAG: hypothetical protein LC664_10520 [Flavobacteriales bacterium]|nr:hypothetical protein [Flavobacteriales bacterium]